MALAGFALLSCGDAVIKSMAGLWAPTAVAALRFTLGAVGLGVVLYWREGRAGFVTRSPALQLLRGGGAALATIGFFSAIFVMPLADATAITFVSPILTGLLSAAFLGERARGRTWAATLLAFVGVIIILRPNVLALGPAALLPLLSALGMSLLMIGNRASTDDGSALAQQFFVSAVAAPLLIGAAALAHALVGGAYVVGIPAPSVVLRCAVVAVSASTAHWLIFRGTARAGAAAAAPMAYVQLLVATVLGWLVFANRPAPLTLLGVAVIIAAGLLLWRGSRTLASPPAAKGCR